MLTRKRPVIILLGALAFIAVANSGGAQLNLAFEDRADLNPRQMSLAMNVAGLAIGFAVSWTDR
jgi:hypothetical protein